MNDNSRCGLCGSKQAKIIHHGTRDIQDIDVLKCEECGLVRLSTFKQITDGFYEESGMRKNDDITRLSIDISMKNDFRRASSLDYMNKSVLDFGCGRGGFLRLARNYAARVAGVELEKKNREKLQKEGITVKSSIESFDEKFDIITMFHVIEHLVEPSSILQKLKKYLKEDGELIIETPNADEALISLYDCEAYKNFSYWGCHVYLYTSDTLEELLRRNGFKINWSSQIQRYPMVNHLYWLSNGKPGGQNIWCDMKSEIIEKEYQKMLEKRKICDTLLISVSPK